MLVQLDLRNWHLRETTSIPMGKGRSPDNRNANRAEAFNFGLPQVAKETRENKYRGSAIKVNHTAFFPHDSSHILSVASLNLTLGDRLQKGCVAKNWKLNLFLSCIDSGKPWASKNGLMDSSLKWQSTHAFLPKSLILTFIPQLEGPPYRCPFNGRWQDLVTEV